MYVICTSYLPSIAQMMLVRKGKLILFEFIIFTTKDCILSAMLLHNNASPHHVGQAHRRIQMRDSHKKKSACVTFCGRFVWLGPLPRSLAEDSGGTDTNCGPVDEIVVVRGQKFTLPLHLHTPPLVPTRNPTLSKPLLQFLKRRVRLVPFDNFLRVRRQLHMDLQHDRTSDFSNHHHQQIAHPYVLCYPRSCNEISGHRFSQQGYDTLTSSVIAPPIPQTIVINKLHILMSSAILVPVIRFLRTKFFNKNTTLCPPP